MARQSEGTGPDGHQHKLLLSLSLSLIKWLVGVKMPRVLFHVSDEGWARARRVFKYCCGATRGWFG